jgi:signal transduction histidine kinase
LRRARARAGDLAHGLKTPLQVIAADIRTLRAQGNTALADEIEKSADAIRQHVERELARARVSQRRGKTQTDVASVARRIIEVVRRTPGSDRLEFRVDVESGCVAAIDEGDLTEMLGNLIENAARFAKTRVSVAAAATTEGTVIAVSDDGPGIPEADRAAVLNRGVALGARRGSGLGLAIVSDIVESYGGRLALADAAPGLAVTVVLSGALSG